MSRMRILDNGWWADQSRKVLAAPGPVLERAYQRAGRFKLGPLRGGPIFQAVALNACLVLPYVVFDRYRCRFIYWIQRGLDLGEAHLPDLSASMNLPRLYPIAHAVFLISLIVPRSRLPVVLVGGVLVFGVGGRLFDPFSVVVLGLFLGGIYLVITSQRLTRFSKLTIAVVAYVLFLNACQFLEQLPVGWSWPLRRGPEIVSISRFGAGFIPLLWYACYEACAGRLSYLVYNVYFLGRFLGAPVFPVRDLRIAEEEQRQWQWRGVSALAVAFVAKALSWTLDGYLSGRGSAWETSSGITLVWFSYCYYLARCFAIVATFNLFIGWARLFGIPIKDNFAFWWLARTPNERWQRWNILFREWIIAYVFYPLMRAKRGLFVAIMATLLTSGVIHVLGYLTPERFDIMKAARIMIYWSVNGLAIYVVIVIPRRFPDLLDRLHVRTHIAWAVLGILSSGLLYAILFMLRDKCLTFAEMLGYFGRLV